jgi:tight adherence protein B
VSVLAPIVVAVAVFLVARLAVARIGVSRLERRVRAHVVVRPKHQQSAAGANRVRRTLDGAERTLARRDWWNAVVLRLDRAGVDRRPIDVLALVASLTLVLATGAAALGSALMAVALLLSVPAGAWLVLASLAQRRVKAFDEQLPDVLAAISSSLRAGHGFLQSLQAVASDTPAPAGPELRRALSETRLGRPADEALAAIAMRVPSKDFSYVLTAIAVQRQVGGSLASLFETVNETVRERQTFTRKVRALTATGRTSAYALVALPFGVAALLSLINHSYLAPLFEAPAGRLMLLLGLASLSVGTVLVRRIVSVKG